MVPYGFRVSRGCLGFSAFLGFCLFPYGSVRLLRVLFSLISFAGHRVTEGFSVLFLEKINCLSSLSLDIKMFHNMSKDVLNLII